MDDLAKRVLGLEKELRLLWRGVTVLLVVVVGVIGFLVLRAIKPAPFTVAEGGASVRIEGGRIVLADGTQAMEIGGGGITITDANGVAKLNAGFLALESDEAKVLVARGQIRIEDATSSGELLPDSVRLQSGPSTVDLVAFKERAALSLDFGVDYSVNLTARDDRAYMTLFDLKGGSRVSSHAQGKRAFVLVEGDGTASLEPRPAP